MRYFFLILTWFAFLSSNNFVGAIEESSEGLTKDEQLQNLKEEMKVIPTEEQLEKLKQALIDYSRLKDPFSVKFREVRIIPGKPGAIFFCGELNSKNSYGAYPGWTPFLVIEVKNDDKVKWTFHIKDDYATQLLVKTFCLRD